MIFALHDRIDAKCCTYARQFFRRTTWRGAFFGGGLCTAPSEVSETISKVSRRGSSCVGLTGSRVPGWGLNDIIIHVVNNLSIRNKYENTLSRFSRGKRESTCVVFGLAQLQPPVNALESLTSKAFNFSETACIN